MSANTEGVKVAANGTFAGQSIYAPDSIGDYHTITVTGRLGGKGLLILDPNTCSVNEFGDRNVCTRLASKHVPVSITETKQKDPQNLGRRQFALEAPELSNPWFLIVYPGETHPRRVVYNDRGPSTPRAVTLEPLVYQESDGKERTHSGAQVALCGEASYVAAQTAGSVLIFSWGKHPTAGYEAYFEELPFDVFPPQFRMMHVVPNLAEQTVTPFVCTRHFEAKTSVDRIIIFDAHGKRDIPVIQVPGPTPN